MPNVDAKAIQRFREDGYLIVRQLWSTDQIARLETAYDALEAIAATLAETTEHQGASFVLGSLPDGMGSGRQIQRVVGCGAVHDDLSELGQAPALVTAACALLGTSEAYQLINQAHFKHPGDGVDFPWHQDSRHRRYGTPVWSDVNGDGSFVESVTAIDPMTAANGALEVIAGSHRLGHLETDPLEELPGAAVTSGPAVTVTLAPGDTVFFGPYLIHGSPPNTSTRPRRAFLNGFAAPGANRRSYPFVGSGRRVTAA